jgi:hypothetical protein
MISRFSLWVQYGDKIAESKDKTPYDERTHNPLVPGSNPGGPTNVVSIILKKSTLRARGERLTVGLLCFSASAISRAMTLVFRLASAGWRFDVLTQQRGFRSAGPISFVSENGINPTFRFILLSIAAEGEVCFSRVVRPVPCAS